MSPKQRFQKSKDSVVFWTDLITNPIFLRGLDAVLLQYQDELPDSDETMTAAARFQRIRGAKRFRDMLINLPEIQKEKTPLPDMNLRPPR